MSKTEHSSFSSCMLAKTHSWSHLSESGKLSLLRWSNVCPLPTVSFDEMPQTWAHVRRWAAFASGYTESKHCSSVSREWDSALIYGSCPEALGYRQLDFWQFIEWLHDLATQWTDSQSASVTAEFIKCLLRGKKDHFVCLFVLCKAAHKLIMHFLIFTAMPFI